jgi:hypothetical protein
MEWTEECNCDSGKPSFDAIEFILNSSKLKIVCDKCLGMICWWPISTKQSATMATHRTKKSLAIQMNTVP